MYSNFVLLDQILFELSCKNTHTHAHKQRHTHTDTHTHTQTLYHIVAFSKNATIIILFNIEVLFKGYFSNLVSIANLKCWVFVFSLSFGRLTFTIKGMQWLKNSKISQTKSKNKIISNITFTLATLILTHARPYLT